MMSRARFAAILCGLIAWPALAPAPALAQESGIRDSKPQDSRPQDSQPQDAREQDFKAPDFSGNDLRDIRIGKSVADLPSEGYADFACAADGGRKVSGWSDWRDCATEANGLHALRYGYDKLNDREGVIVAGHPAVLTLLVDNDGKIGGLRIETDPKARLYLRKKAFLFGAQIKSRYGQDGWSCKQAQPEGDEQAVGGVFIKERCTKAVAGRDITFERSLYRHAGSDAKTFVDETRMTILRAAS